MAEAKGPKVAVPDELLAELEENDSAKASASEAPAEEAASPDAEDPAGDEASEDAAASDGDLEAAQDKYLRLAAEFENFKRRSLKERQDLHNFANEGLIKELLATVDNLERAVGHGRQEEGDAKSLLEGVELTFRSLMQALEKSGLASVSAEGEPFDPQVHEAIRQVESEQPAGTVVEVFQKGYLLKDRLLRAALVSVSSGPGEKAEE